MPELGTKHECFNCEAKFYDLGRPEAVCPKCGANQKDAKKQEVVTESHASRRKRRDEVVAVEPEASEASEPESGSEEFGDDELVSLDVSDDDSGDDDDDLDDDD